MSTGKMPNPPGQPTIQASGTDVKTQAAPSAAQVAPPEAAPAPAPAAEAPVPLNEEVARLIEGQADIVAQQMVYHSQMLMGVSALGTDPVNARNAALVVANAMRNNTPDRIVPALVSLGSAQVSQVNDRTLPYRLNAQIAGLFEGILLETLTRAFYNDASRSRDARMLLEEVFQRANELADKQPKTALILQAPGGGPNARS